MGWLNMFSKSYRVIAFLPACLLLNAGLLSAQETRLPKAEDVKATKAKYEAERDRIVKSGIDKLFLPILVEKADEMAKKADVALSAGRLLQATELYRQARWQLPYASKNVPEKNVAKVLGNLRLRHGQEIYALSFSPDGKLLATGSRDRTVKIWDLENGHELLTYTGHNLPVRALAFSADGKYIASGGAEQDIRLWDPRTGKDVKTFKGQGVYVTGAVFSKDSKYLFVSQSGDTAKGGSAGIVTVYEVESGNIKRSITDFRLMVHSVGFNHDGSILGVGVGDGTMKTYEYPRLVDNPAQPEYWSHQDLNGAVYQLVYSPDNRQMVSIGADGVKFYAMPTPGAPFAVATPRKSIIGLVAPNRYTCGVFSKDGKTLFTGAKDGLIRVFDAETAEQTATFKGHNNEITSLSFNPGGTQLASSSADYTVRLWDFDIVLQSRDYTGHEGPVWTAFFNSDSTQILTASADKTARVVQVGSGEVIHTLKGHASPVTFAVWSPNNKYIATGSGDKLIKIWDANTGKHLKDLEGHTGTVTTLDFAADNTRLVSGAADKTIRIWDVESGKSLVLIKDNKSVVASVAFHPKGNQVAVANVDQTIKLYDAAGKLEHGWSAHAIAVTGVAYSPNGSLLASCGADNLVRVWSLAKPGDTPLVLSGHTGPLSAVAFRNDNQHLVSCGADTTVKLWKLEGASFKEAQTFRGHREWVSSVSFSKDGYFVLSCGVDKLVKIWEITSREIPFLTEHTGSVDAVAISPDGKLIASGATDKTIKVWNRETGVEICTLRGHSEGILSLVFLQDNKTLVSGGIDRNIKLWDVTAAKEITLLPGQQMAFTGLITAVPYMVAPAGGGKFYAWLPEERRSNLIGWDPMTGNETFNIYDGDGKKDQRSVAACSFSADGKRAATVGRDGTLRIYDLEKKALIPGPEWLPFAKGVAVGDIALNTDGSLLVVTSEQGEVKVLDVAKRDAVKTFKAHPGRINACMVSGDGKRLATVGADNHVKLWDVTNGAELRGWDVSGAERGSFLHSLAFAADGRHLVTGNANTTVFVLELP